ncbi:MAG: hypothetical protein RH942_03370 [Kiloniellaceae bacterium]
MIAVLIAFAGPVGGVSAQPESLIGAKAVASVSYDDLRRALLEAGATDIRDLTVDPKIPSFGGVHSQAASLQGVLYACDVVEQRCRGVQLISLIPATTRRTAQIIVGGVERTAFSIDARVTELVNRPDSVAVMLSSYLVYDYGVSEQLLPIALEQFRRAIDQTKKFMLKDDPAHADLWAKQAGN